jgi:RimJ/RimL family protein N-acetyltransferase
MSTPIARDHHPALIRNVLRGERVRLTAMTERDVPIVAGWQNDGEFLRLYDAVPAAPRSEARIAEWLSGSQKRADGYLFGIRPLLSEDLIGYIEFDGILWNQGTGSFSIAIGDPTRRGQGYGTEALRLAVRFAFEELNLHRLEITVFSYNRRAITVYEKLGFRHEGTHREFLYRDGLRHDMLLYGLLRREWDVRVQGARE